MSAIKKILLLLLLLTAVAAAVLTGFGVHRYYQDLRKDTAIEQLGKVTITPDKGGIASPLTVTAQFKCPWHRRPVEAVVNPVKGLVMTGAPQISRVKTGFGFNVWEVKTVLEPYRTGDLKGSTMQVVFNRKNDNHKITSLDLPLPPVNVREFTPADNAKLALASRLEKEIPLWRKYLPLLIAAAVVLIAAIPVWFWLKRRRDRLNAPLPPWQAALLELATLRDLLHRSDADKPTCFVRLTDIVRNYLEKRFQLKAPQQTTEEFMRDMNRTGSPLQEHQRSFLGEFMNAADLVKFASLPADEGLLEQAIGKAETLVTETRPQTEEDKK